MVAPYSAVDASSRRAGALTRVLVLAPDGELDVVGRLSAAPHPLPFVVERSASASAGLDLARATAFDVIVLATDALDAATHRAADRPTDGPTREPTDAYAGGGLALVRALRSVCPHAEVILIADCITATATVNALRAGAFVVVPRALSAEDFTATLELAAARARASRERDDLERRYRSLVDLTDVVVVGLDPSDRVALFNRNASTLAGIAPEDAVGRSFLDSWIAAEDRARMAESLAAARSTDRPREVEVPFVEHGTLVPAPQPERRRLIRWHLSSVHDASVGGAMVYGIGIDITDRRRLERRAADAEALSAMGALAMNLAHEIRNPLNAAVLQLHLIQRDVERLTVETSQRERLKTRAEVVEREVGRLNRLLTEFLDLARPRELAREPIHLATLIEGIVELESAAAAEAGVRVVADLPSDGCVALGDSGKLKQVLLNLVVNAVEAMRGGGTLRIALRCAAGHASICVADTGPGIAAPIREQVFEPFFTTKEGGTGLGLSIVRKIVDQHGGTIRIVCPPSGGTEVEVTIPTGIPRA